MNKARSNIVDRIVSYFNPVQGAKRAAARGMVQVMASGYNHPGSRKHSMIKWSPSRYTADGELVGKSEGLRAGARDLYMNTPIATAALRRTKTNVVGPGLKLQASIDSKALNIDQDEAEIWQSKVEREFRHWCKHCDATGTDNFRTLQGLVFLSYLMSGDVFTIFRHTDKKQSPYKLALQIIEADQVGNPHGNINGKNWVMGVKLDVNDKPVAYHVKSWDPVKGEWFDKDDQTIPLYGERSGELNILHVFERERPGQHRGIPMLAPVLLELKQLSRLTEAELMAAVVQSFLTIFVKSANPDGSPIHNFTTDADAIEDADTNANVGDEEENSLDGIEMGSGTMIQLDDGQSIDMADPSRPSGKFEPFFNALVKQIAASTGITFEVLTQHFTSSYSASRAAIQEAWKFFSDKRSFLIDKFCQPVYERFLVEAIATGRVQAPGFFSDPIIRDAWCSATWTGRGQGQLDPLKETKAARERIDANLSTHETEAQRLGNDDWQNTPSVLQRENNLLIEHGLKPGGKNYGDDDPDVQQSAKEEK